MKIQTLSIVCGTKACNAKCPFCVSKTTFNSNLPVTKIKWRNLKIACKLAEKAGATTCLITGKGEPTLYPNLVTDYINYAKDYFPLIELQTNGINLNKEKLKEWYKCGLTTISISAVETGVANKKIYGKEHNLEEAIKKAHDSGLSIRLSIIMLKKYIDRPNAIKRMIKFCKDQKVKQLTIRPVSRPKNIHNDVTEWIKNHMLSDEELYKIKLFLEEKATPVLHLPHGATVYDYEGQNICLSNCLTTNETDDDMRQIIFFPNGTISYDWCFRGAVLL